MGREARGDSVNQEQEQQDDLLTIPQAAELMDRQKDWVYELVRRNRVPWELHRGTRRIRREDALEYALQHPVRRRERQAPQRDPGYERTHRTMVSLTPRELEWFRSFGERYGGGRSISRGIRALRAIYLHEQETQETGEDNQ